jgi:hypothetical protein
MRAYMIGTAHFLALGLVGGGCFVVTDPATGPQTAPAPPAGPTVVQTTAAAPTAGPTVVQITVPAPAAGPACMAGPTAAQSVREIPWRDCTYQSSNGPVTVTNGDFVTGEEGGDVWFEFRVDDVEFGDLTGDGSEEALVATANVWLPHGDSGALTIYGLSDGVLTVLGLISYSGREADQIVDSSIVGRSVVLRRSVWHENDAGCCPSEERTETWSWNGSGFVEDESQRTSRVIAQ